MKEGGEEDRGEGEEGEKGGGEEERGEGEKDEKRIVRGYFLSARLVGGLGGRGQAHLTNADAHLRSESISHSAQIWRSLSHRDRLWVFWKWLLPLTQEADGLCQVSSCLKHQCDPPSPIRLEVCESLVPLSDPVNNSAAGACLPSR